MSAHAKKVVLFMVEGPTDETSLALVFEHLLGGASVAFDVLHGDVTTFGSRGRHVEASVVRNRVRKMALDHICHQPYGWSDLGLIVQITDTDGAYIPADRVVEDPSCETYRCEEERILTSTPDLVRERNDRKRAATLHLTHVTHLTYRSHKVPYRIYFFSRNLEHALHGRATHAANSTKVRLAQEFRKRYAHDTDAFRRLVNSDEVRVEGGYEDTWGYIVQGTNSLGRASNIHLLVNGSGAAG